MARNLKNLKQTDGKAVEAVRPAQAKGNIRSMDELLKHNLAPYNTHDAEEYKLSIDSLNSVDLQREAIRVGLLPNINRDILIERLTHKFALTTQALIGGQSKPKQLKISKRGLDVLAEGANKLI